MMHKSRARSDRRGVILLVVLAMLTLLAILGVTFVLYSSAEATTGRIHREAEDLASSNIPDVSAQQALFMFLGQLVYDLPDDQTGVYSALRGHSLARTIYGYNPASQDDKAFNGTGRLHYTSPIGGATGYAADDAYLVNFTYFQADGWLRDPERYGSRTALNPATEGTYTGGANVPYTYPDHQNMFLAMMRSDGTVLMPSYHRKWLFDPTNMGYPANPNYTNAAGKYLTCIVRPADMGAGFPTPDANGLSVKNLPWAPGGNDSGWVDIGAPIMYTGSGTPYRMLVAPLIIELDSKLNLNVMGNILGAGNSHASNQGWGAFEANLSKILNAGGAPAEWQQLFLGTPPSVYTNPQQATVNGRYGNTKLPMGTGLSAGTAARAWAPADMNGTQDPAPGKPVTGPMVFPGAGGVAPYQCFPSFPAGYGNGVYLETTDNGQQNGTPIHPLIYNAQRPQGGNRAFATSGMYSLLNYLRSNSGFVSSDLGRLCPQNFTNNGDAFCTNRRNLVTLLSFDVDRPGTTPYVWDATDTTNTPTTRYQLSTALYPTGGGSGQGISFPNPATQRGNTPAPPNSEFDGASWRSLVPSALGRIDLNRPLTLFPAPDPNTGLMNLANAAAQAQAQQALTDRQLLALDVFNRLRAAAGALPPATAFPMAPGNGQSPEYAALRYLAQLAANIVDYIDYDDYNTPFNWDPSNGGWVFGTELPRLVINEFYVSYDNDGNDPGLKQTPPKATTNYNANVWVELHNPFFLDSNQPVYLKASDGTSPLPDQKAILHNGTNANYLLVLAKPGIGGTIRNPANVTGDPDYGMAMGTTNIYTNTAGTPCVVGSGALDFQPSDGSGKPNQVGDFRVVQPGNGTYSVVPSANGVNNGGFYVIAPNVKAPNYFATGADPNLPYTTLRNEMSYPTSVNAANAAVLPQPTVLLRRLACPGLPPQTNPTQPFYNPYITVDYIEIPTAAPPAVPQEVNDGRLFTPAGAVAPAPVITTFKSWGRTQPYTAGMSTPAVGATVTPPLQYSRMAQLPAAPAPGQPLHTFFRHNAVEGTAPPAVGTANQTLKVPFDWLVHLDRQLISPMELLHVSGFKPQELTQQFVDQTTGAPFSHRAPWYDQNSRLYRFFELVETKSRANGVALGGRIPGKVNINMLWDIDPTGNAFSVFSALCDAQSGNNFQSLQGAGFTQAQVNQVLLQMLQQRSPTADGSGVPGQQMPGPADRPFWSFGIGANPTTLPMGQTADAMDPNAVLNPTTVTPRGIDNTLLRGQGGAPSATSMPRTFDPFPADASVPGAMNPYQRLQLLNKIYNNLTTRSNVFAVWLTVGFFQVTNQATQPYQLGAEIIPSSGGPPIRHHMFAIVDRTQLQCFTTTTSQAQAVSTNVATPVDLSLAAKTYTQPYTNRTYNVQVGSVLVFEPNTDNEETVIVTGTNAMSGNPQGVVTKAHGNGVQVIVRGNPGPWANYDPRKDTSNVVPFYYIID